VWVHADDQSAVLSRFINRDVNSAHPGDPRFDAIVRTFVSQAPLPGDEETLAELRRDGAAVAAFSLYAQAQAHEGAIITITEEGDMVLGLSLDDPDDSLQTRQRAATLMAVMKAECIADAGVAGDEAPPQSACEWAHDAVVLLRDGRV
jgi:hypothetical protein